MNTSACSSRTRSRRSASSALLSGSDNHWNSSTSSATSTDNAIAKFSGEWNCSQSRAAANAASRSCNARNASDMVSPFPRLRRLSHVQRRALFSRTCEVPKDRLQSAGQFHRAVIVEVSVVSENRSAFVNCGAETVEAEKWLLRDDLSRDSCAKLFEQRPRAAGSLAIVLHRQTDGVFDAVALRRVAPVPHGERYSGGPKRHGIRRLIDQVDARSALGKVRSRQAELSGEDLPR